MKKTIIGIILLLPLKGLDSTLVKPYFFLVELPPVTVTLKYITEVELATVYHAVEEQTDDTPLITASGKRIDPSNPQRFVAISWDLKDKLSFGDTIYVSDGPHKGPWVVEDLMNRRWKNKIDFLVPKKIYTSYQNVKIWKR